MKIENKKYEYKLILKCKEGDSKSFKDLMQIYRRIVLGYLFKMLRNKELVEDSYQEIMIKVWQKISHFNEDKNFRSWLFVIVHNCAIDHMRKKNLHAIEEFNENALIVNNFEDPHESFIKDETQKIIDEAVEELPELQKTVFLLRQQSQLKFKEISKILDQPINTVLSHMNYASKKIRKILEERYEY